MATRTNITDAQHKKMLALYAECGSYRRVAREMGLSDTTVRRHLQSDPSLAQMVAEKKAENTKSVLSHMETQTTRVCGLLDDILAHLSDPDKLTRATPSQLATTLGILIDKYTAPAAAKGPGNNLLEAITQATKGRLEKEADT